jgi:hypothetical protein
MRRIQFIELHDQPWFPGFLRDLVTEALKFGLRLFNAYAPVAPLLRSLLDAQPTPAIVDLCSGAGGPWLELAPAVQKGRGVQITLTDKYPNLKSFERMKVASGGRIEFCAKPVDAMRVPRDLAGVRTIFTSFHHFPPEEAAALLRDSIDARQPIGIFEVTARAPIPVAWMLPWPLFIFLYTPWIRPFRWSRLVWTYLFPVVPFVMLFDGIVSCLRSYRPDELLRIAHALKAPEYRWVAGEVAGRAGGKITYLIGSFGPAGIA